MNLTLAPSSEATRLPIPLATLAGQDLSELEAKATAAAEAMRQDKESVQGPQQDTKSTIGVAVTTDEISVPEGGDVEHGVDSSKGNVEEDDVEGDNDSNESDETDDGSSYTSTTSEEGPPRESDPDEDDVVFMGLRVYTNKASPAVVGGQLRHEMAISFAGLAINDL